MAGEDFRVVHALPGRVRLRAARVKGNPQFARQVEERLRKVPAVLQVEAKSATGSVLVQYRPQAAAGAEFLQPFTEALTALFPEADLVELPALLVGSAAASSSTPLVRQIRGVFGTLNAGVEQASGGVLDLRVLLPLALFALGLRSLLTSEKIYHPDWHDFFWFSLSTFFMLNPQGQKEE